MRSQGAPRLPAGFVRSLGPLLVLAIGVTALVLLFMWRDQAGYKPIFGAREKVVAADMMSVLDAEGVKYRVHPDSGQVMVAESQLGKVRMLLAAKGVVAKLPNGLELMDRNDPLGVSQFVQDVRFRRGLEGELAQSIMTFDSVESARVHLSIAKSSSFVVSDGEKSSASVMVQLKPGKTLSHEQIAAAIKLVAGSVASLDAKRVSLVDQAGNLLSSRIDLAEEFEGSEGDTSQRHFQDETRRSVRELLAPVLGEDNYKATVTADVDNDRIQETREKYGADPKVTNEAMREESDRDRMAIGVPGSLSNRPVAVAASSPAEASTAQKNATTRQYAYDRTITQIKRSRGRLARLSVAVALNNHAAPGGKGTWTPAEITGVENMLRSGLGINAERGDKLSVSAFSFPVPPPIEPWWQQRDNVIDIGSGVLWTIGSLFGFLLIVRPVLRLMQQQFSRAPSTSTELAMLPAGAAAAGTGSVTPLTEVTQIDAAGNPTSAKASASGSPSLALPGVDTAPTDVSPMPVIPLLENYDLPPPGSPVDVLVDHLKVLAAKEPERVAEVVKQWVQKHGQPD